MSQVNTPAAVSSVITGAEQTLQALVSPFVKRAADRVAQVLGVTDPVGITQLEATGQSLLAAAGVAAAPLAQKLLGGLLSKLVPAAAAKSA